MDPKRAASPDGEWREEAVAVPAKAKPKPVPAKAHGIDGGRPWCPWWSRAGAGIVCCPMVNDWDQWAHVGLTENMKEVISELIKGDMMRGLVNSYGYSEELMVITYDEHTFIHVKWEKRQDFCTDTLLVYKIIDLFTETTSDWD